MWSEGHDALGVGASHPKSPPRSFYVGFRWKYIIVLWHVPLTNPNSGYNLAVDEQHNVPLTKQQTPANLSIPIQFQYFRNAIRKFVTHHTNVFNDKMTNNIISKWYLLFTTKSFQVAAGSNDYKQLFSAAFPGETAKEFKKGKKKYISARKCY